jgi:5-methylcytosine-specific restriction protein A
MKAALWRVIEPMLPGELPDLVGPTDNPSEIERRSSRYTWLGPGSQPPAGVHAPARSSEVVATFLRDPAVVAWVRAQALGKCEKCGDPAPFSTPSGQPFLEVHHVRRLADGGSDTVTNAVAVCPNCHRRCHFAADPEAERVDLYVRVTRLAPE